MKLLDALLLACALAIAPHAEAQHHEWDYGKDHGPGHWEKLKPDFATCGIGKAQSPIDIRNAQAGNLEPIRFDYQPSPLRIIDNGHTIQTTTRRAARSPSATSATSCSNSTSTGRAKRR